MMSIRNISNAQTLIQYSTSVPLGTINDNHIPGAIYVQGTSNPNSIYIGKGGGAALSNLGIGAGQPPLYNNTTGINNTGVGSGAIYFNIVGNNNAAFGGSALNSVNKTNQLTSDDNTAIGYGSLGSIESGNRNTGVGSGSMSNALSSTDNTAVGYRCLLNQNGSFNTAIGSGAGPGNSTNSVAIGANALNQVYSGSNTNNVAIGYAAQVYMPTTNSASNSLSIQNVIYGNNMTSASAGLIGIGTSTPGSKLDVKGALRLSSTSSSGYVGFVSPASPTTNVTYTLPSADGTSGQVLTTNGSSTLSWTTPPAATGITSSCSTVGKIPYTSSAGGNLSCSNITFDNTNSYVGIGTASPAATLHVNGTVRLQGLPTNSPTNYINPLLIDANGDLWIGNATLSRPAVGDDDLQTKVDSLESEVSDFKKQVSDLRSLVELMITNNSSSSNKLFSVSPNPANGRIHVEPIKNFTASSKYIEVRDINNSSVIAKTAFNGTIDLTVNNTLSNGTYLVVIYDNANVIQTEKVTVIK
ncbi:T9SS type A sorting domain-containing protein [Ferruginibacter albus]|uniref:T9SS type A sorting domain-containing protein n=1 Tax=Ferruginibacter albus TaxID=2875540 RepID=UPI001CC6C596|nr:T9SS type A sorting domain-containing protein [Ferruginibacter albus]UAY53424.1 T9SS type A sorting domain-containing protein [Ferruginibacter albus]